MAVFAIIAIPLSYMKLGSQSIIHVILMSYAIICFTLLIGTCIFEIIENGLSYEDLELFFSHSALALVSNISVPDIIRPARNKNKVQYPIIVAVSVATMFYGCVGSVCSITFGEEIKSPITLNWGNYTGIDGGWGSGETLWFAYIIRYFIMFFPIANVLSSFPIVVVSTSSNIESMFSPEIKLKYGRIIHYSSITFCIIIPFCLASLSSSLELIFDISGSFCFLLAFIIPCIFHILSIPLLQKIHWFKPKPKTPYTWYHSIPILSVILCLISICSFVLSVILIVIGMIRDEGTTNNSTSIYE
ncbi:Amino acid transporter transmembrane domain-containing protein [Entamoeba marina]